MSWESIVPVILFSGLAVLWLVLVLRGGAGG
jgi:hypothetical protein